MSDEDRFRDDALGHMVPLRYRVIAEQEKGELERGELIGRIQSIAGARPCLDFSDGA